MHVTEHQYSWVLNMFQGAIMLQPLCGYLVDAIGLKLAFGIFAVAWSLICMAHGLAHHWQALAGLRWLPQQFDASILSDEATAPGLPNFTGGFVGMACQDLAGTLRPADFDLFEYRERSFCANLLSGSLGKP